MSAEIEIEMSADSAGWVANVRVSEEGTRTSHKVRVSRETAKRLGAGASPEAMVQASFEFLLEREPKESILRDFDLIIIGHYFPDYEKEIRKRLSS